MTLTLRPSATTVVDPASTTDRAGSVASSPTSPRLPEGVRAFFVLHAAGWLIALAAVLLRESGPAASVVALVYLTWFPGDALRAALRVRADDVHLRALFGVTGSVVVLLGVALLSSVVIGPRDGDGLAALDPAPLFTLLTLVVGACLAAVAFSREHVPAAVPSLTQWAAWGTLLVVAQLTWIGAKFLDTGRGPWLTIAALVVLGGATVWSVVSTRPLAHTLQPALVFFLTLGIAWSFSMRGDHLYGFDLHQERLWAQNTIDAGAWQRVVGDPYAAMLSITALPASLVSLTGIGVFTYFKAWAPIMLALYTMGAFCFLSRFAGRTAALVVTLLLFFIPTALWQLPAVSRQDVALAQFVVTMLLMFGAGGTGRGVTAFTCLTAATIGVTHYTSAYVALAIVGGGLVLSVLVRRVRPAWRQAPRHLPTAVVLALTIGALGWNVAFTQSSLNVGSAVEKSAQGGLRQEAGLLQTFLSGATIAEVPPAEYVAETRLDAEERTWLLPYSPAAQRDMTADMRALTLPEQYGPAAALAPVSEPAFVLLRQLANLLMVAGVALLVWRLVRDHRTAVPSTSGDAAGEVETRRPDLDLVALAVVALALTVFTRFNAQLSQSYNPERLLMQTALFLGVGAALVPAAVRGALGRRASAARVVPVGASQALAADTDDNAGASAPAARPTRGGGTRHRLPRLAAAALAAVLVFDATGLRAFTIIKDSGNLQRGGEYERRFGHTDADVAAAAWLAQRFRSHDMLFADTYGALLPQSTPGFEQGLFGELSPATLDQRAYVLGTTENVHGGRARLTKRSVRTVFTFPRTFLSTYKSRIYSNGSAEVYR